MRRPNKKPASKMESNWALVLVAPFLVLVGVIVKGVIDWISARLNSKTGEHAVRVSEREAQTHEFEAIVEGFVASLNVTREQAARAEDRVMRLESRVTVLEGDKSAMLDHISLLESMIPNPPGPPKRPYFS
jgi:outer membrane murein-binding lipoprotein Lpp